MRLLPDVSQSKRPMLLAIGIRVVCGRRRGLPNPRFAQERSDKKSLGRQEVFRRCRERQTSWDGRVGPRCTNETDASRPKRPTCRVGIKIKEVCRRRRGLPDARARRLAIVRNQEGFPKCCDQKKQVSGRGDNRLPDKSRSKRCSPSKKLARREFPGEEEVA